ncbi:hypothetical protein BU15DRAFT_88933 [Melanogaster broomeanus]|nr:hypothetical protein BU15DRAFT_88933 [Melanogaster broomeanus]
MTPVPPLQTPSPASDAKEDQSTNNLSKARELAKKNHKYDSTLTRLKICEEFEKRTNGKKPYDWQLNVAEALLTGLDCVVVAGTGAGKTMPFIMPLLVQPKKHIIVISPLDALETDQMVSSLGLTAVAVNRKTYDVKLQKHTGFRTLLIVDEAHCITQWGDKFREQYSKLGSLRAFPSAVVRMSILSLCD